MEKAAAERAQQELAQVNAKAQSKQEKIMRLLDQGAALDKKKEYAAAAVEYNEAMQLDPDNTSIYFKLGWSEFKAGSA